MLAGDSAYLRTASKSLLGVWYQFPCSHFWTAVSAIRDASCG